MTTMITEVYDAFVSAGADDGKARRAAEVLADYENHFGRLERRMDTLQVELEHKIGGLDNKIGGLDNKIDTLRNDVDARIDLAKSELGGRINLPQWQLAPLIGGVTAIILKLFI